MKPIYLDNNATTYLDPLVAKQMYDLALRGVANPASQHRPGREALHLLEQAKTQILASLGSPLDTFETPQVILTSGGTEANNLALFGSLAKRPGYIIVGATDHPSVIEAARHAVPVEKCKILPVDQNGLCSLDALSDILHSIYAAGDRVSLVSVMLGNNETGVLQDIAQICQLCQEYSVPVHSDIVQAVGKIPVDMKALGLSAVTLTAHKIHGPVGIGGLIVSPSFSLQPMLVGGGQQLGLRPGTEPVIPAVGLAGCLEQIMLALESGTYSHIEDLRNRFEERLVETCDAFVVAADAPRLPHTSNISFPGIDRQALHMALDLKGVACSTGSACSSGSGRPSGSLVAMGLADDVIQGSLRFSLSRFTSEEDILTAAEIVSECVLRCRQTI